VGTCHKRFALTLKADIPKEIAQLAQDIFLQHNSMAYKLRWGTVTETLKNTASFISEQNFVPKG